MTHETSAILYKPESQYRWDSDASNPRLVDIIRDDLILIRGKVTYEGKSWYDFSGQSFCAEQECHKYSVQTKKKRFRVISPISQTKAESHRSHKTPNYSKIKDEQVMTFLIKPGKFKSEEKKKANYIIDVSESEPQKEKNKVFSYLKGNAKNFGYIALNAPTRGAAIGIAELIHPLLIAVLTGPTAIIFSAYTLLPSIPPLFRKRYYLDK